MIAIHFFDWGNENNLALSAGNYTFSLKDSNECIELINISINEPDKLDFSKQIRHVSCFGYNDGELTVTPAGGTAPYVYLWNDPTANQTATRHGRYT